MVFSADGPPPGLEVSFEHEGQQRARGLRREDGRPRDEPPATPARREPLADLRHGVHRRVVGDRPQPIPAEHDWPHDSEPTWSSHRANPFLEHKTPATSAFGARAPRALKAERL